jgi:hypothetical protein
MVTAAVQGSPVRWSWLWGQRSDLTWNFAPFWSGFVLAGVLFVSSGVTGSFDHAVWRVNLFGHSLNISAVLLYLYAPLVDAPHLWATVARTYTDPEEWAQRRRLFLASLLWLVAGPVVILIPYLMRATVGFPAGKEAIAWLVWTRLFELYALFHIAKQHWGFISLYKRKNADLADEHENRIDALFFKTAIWLPYLAMLTAPWYVDFDGRPFAFLTSTVAGHTLGWFLHTACNVALVLLSACYAAFQFLRWRRGIARNGPKLVYVATVVLLYFLTFGLNPLVAAFWVLITGFGHCAQYHRIVWAYGVSKYGGKSERSLPTRIFDHAGLYIALGVVFGIVTLQGPLGLHAQQAVAAAFEGSSWHRWFAFLNRGDALTLGARIAAACFGGVRLHHFYVDSKIWRVSKSAALAKNLQVAT